MYFFGRHILVSHATVVFGILDMIAVVCFLRFAWWYKYSRIPELVTKHSKVQATPGDYAIVVEYLPEMLPPEFHLQYDRLLANHFQRVVQEELRFRGQSANVKVCEVAFAHDFDGKLGDFRELRNLHIARAIELEKGSTWRLHRVEKQISRLCGQTRDRKSLRSRPVCRAFVTFDRPEWRNLALSAYRRSRYTIGRIFQPAWLRFNGRALQVHAAPEPSDIRWENQDMPWSSRAGRTVLSYSMIMFLLAITCLFTIRAKQFQQSGMREIECTAENASDDYCKCLGLGLQKIVWGDPSLWGVCKAYLLDNADVIAWVATSASTVTVVNLILRYVAEFMTDFERPLCYSDWHGSLMPKTLLGQFINLAMVVLLLNMTFLGGHFSDMGGGWYDSVGAAICLQILFTTFMPLLSVLCVWVQRLYRETMFYLKTHQHDVNQLFTNNEFPISSRSGESMCIVWAALTYSSGMPLLLFFAVLHISVSYWVDKWLLLRCSKRPPKYDKAMAERIVSVMPIFALAHCLMGIWMLGHPTFPSMTILPMKEETGFFDTMLSRSFRLAALPLTCVAACLIVYLVWVVLKNFIVAHQASFLSVEDLDVEATATYPNFNNAVPIMQSKGILHSYEMRANGEFADILRASEEKISTPLGKGLMG